MSGVGSVNLTPSQRRAAMMRGLGVRPNTGPNLPNGWAPPPGGRRPYLLNMPLEMGTRRPPAPSLESLYTGLNLPGDNEEDTTQTPQTPPPLPAQPNPNARAAFPPMRVRKEKGGSRRRSHKRATAKRGKSRRSRTKRGKSRRSRTRRS